MYLKKLQLQGFKTFASKTEFLYDSGITAIVGPNGSGKSNIADAIRWVLGEQRYSMLRGKKTEDVIFAGSALKAGMGFAEASITFDNSDAHIPLEFNEVTVTRRAYRSGENEYYINKSRVRLKDVQETVSKISSTYSVITQGMVDAALSQKPEERRSLFEDAAAIGHFNVKKAEAEDRLNKTQDNMQRVADILAEIGPRLKSLEKSAKQAEEYYGLQEDLQTMFRRWYGYRWRKIQLQGVEARQKEQQAGVSLQECELNLEALKEQTATARHRQNERRAVLVKLHRDSSTLHNRAQQLQQQVAVDRERLNGLNRQQEGQKGELVNLRIQAEGNAARLDELEREFQAIKADQQEIAGRVGEQEQAQKAKATETRQVEEKLTRRREEVMRQGHRLETLQNRLGQLAQRRAELTRQQEQYFQQRDTAIARQGEVGQELTTAESTLTAFEAELTKLAARRQEIERETTTTNEALRQHERNLQDFRAKREANRSHLELLNRLQSSFAGLHSGVKSVLQAGQGQNPKLKGVLGLVANLLAAPADLEVAIETALGGHTQDIVVESWAEAEAAISFLKSSGSGRATFMPLDSLKDNGPGNIERKVLKTAGVRGIASDLIEYDNKHRAVYEQLLGRTLIVEDLQVARAILSSLPTGFTAVTLGGELIRSGGSVSGGATGKDRAEGSMLLRERELRELPKQITTLEKQIAEEATSLSQRQGQLATLRQQLAEQEREIAQMNRSQQQAREKLAGLKAQADRLTAELKLREENHQSLAREVVGLDEQERGIKQEQKEAEKLRTEAQTGVKTLERESRLAHSVEQDEREKLAALRTTAALAEQRLKNSESNLQYGRAEQKRLAEQIAGREGQLAQLDKQRATLQTDLEQAQAEFSKLGGQLDRLRAEINPLEKELEALEKEQTESEKRWNSLSSTLLTLEAGHSRAELESQRVQNDLENLLVQVSTDLAPSLIAEQGENFQVDPAEWAELLELSSDEAKQLQERIEQHRGKLRRIGVVNPLALQEYKETNTRHAFLSGQLADLEQAALSLRSLIKELDTLTQQKFGETFELVATEFSKYFGLLFNGGSAKLFLTDPENLAQTGIEIIAQPPGKRQQNLALLSGGERALTAVALLFALLEVNPTPFCVLDEVDAALDEANVNRFCETLQKLAARTQFIVITHNRGTIESARTIYGISMGADSVSKTISLRVDDVAKFRQAVNANSHKKSAKPVAVS